MIYATATTAIISRRHRKTKQPWSWDQKCAASVSPQDAPQTSSTCNGRSFKTWHGNRQPNKKEESTRPRVTTKQRRVRRRRRRRRRQLTRESHPSKQQSVTLQGVTPWRRSRSQCTSAVTTPRQHQTQVTSNKHNLKLLPSPTRVR